MSIKLRETQQTAVSGLVTAIMQLPTAIAWSAPFIHSSMAVDTHRKVAGC